MPRCFIALAGGAIAACVSTSALAQATSWPERTVRVIVPFAAGGATDAIARPWNDELSKAFGQQFVVENRGGVVCGQLRDSNISKPLASASRAL